MARIEQACIIAATVQACIITGTLKVKMVGVLAGPPWVSAPDAVFSAGTAFSEIAQKFNDGRKKMSIIWARSAVYVPYTFGAEKSSTGQPLTAILGQQRVTVSQRVAIIRKLSITVQKRSTSPCGIARNGIGSLCFGFLGNRTKIYPMEEKRCQ